MIPLNRKQFPSARADISQALDEAAHRYASKDGPIVDLKARVYPYIDGIAVNLDGAELKLPAPPRPKIQGETSSAFESAALTVSGKRISVRGLPFDLRLDAHDLVFHKAEDENGDAVLIIHSLHDGTLSISAAQLDLEKAIERIVKQEGRGVTIDQVRLAMRARGHRSLAIDVQVYARKLFLKTRIDISTQIAIDDDFAIRVSNSKCKGEGAIGSIACTTLEPIFKKLEEKSFSLKSLPLGEIHIRDIRLTVADTVELTADFGSKLT
jgi:hypothetical protein